MTTTKLRILCLHGFTSNGAVHAHQLRRLVSLLPEYDFLFPSGPHTVDITAQMDLSKPANQAWTDLVNSLSPALSHRAWWFARDIDRTTQEAGSFHGLEDSLRFLGAYMAEHGPVHAIWGFSQGACLAGMLCALLQDKQSAHPLRRAMFSEDGAAGGGGCRPVTPASGVIFSGFRARFPQYDGVYEAGIDVPLLHVLGEQDALVREGRSEALMKVCDVGTSKLLRHDGGHDIPRKEGDLREIVEFVRKYSGLKGDERRGVQASI